MFRPPILFQHGLQDSADTWIVNYVDKAPALVAASAGYDVWIGNLRGNKYSNMHETLDPVNDEKEFFDFSIYHHTNYDLVSMIDYIQEYKRSDPGNLSHKLAYVGHSMGTTIFFRLAAQQRAYIERNISAFIGLGPVIVPTNSTAPIVHAVKNHHERLYKAMTSSYA